MDKRIREILRANEKLDTWQVKRQALSPSWTKQWDGRKEKEQKRKRKKKERVLKRETLPSL